MNRPLKDVLDHYCLARAMGRREEQVGLANALVDEYIPDLVQRLATAIIERNKAWNENDNLGASR